jgi:tetratricopeptide (TPR) repeat protein
VRDVAASPLAEVARRTRWLVERGRSGRLTAADMQGGVFTLTSLGSFGIEFFNPVINWPESAILGLGAIRQQPNSAQLHAQLGNVLARANNNAEALTEYRTATRLDPRNVGYLHRLADLQIATGDRPGAVGTLQRILTIAPGDPAATRRLAALQQ